MFIHLSAPYCYTRPASWYGYAAFVLALPYPVLRTWWSATAIVAMIGPAAFWSIITRLVAGGDIGLKGMATWVPCLFYTSWFLWAIAAGAATRSYQLRSVSSADNSTNVAGS